MKYDKVYPFTEEELNKLGINFKRLAYREIEEKKNAETD